MSGLSKVTGQLVGYSATSGMSVQTLVQSCTSPTAYLYKMNSSGELESPALDSTALDAEGKYSFSSQAIGKSDYAGTLLVEVRDCSSHVYYRPVTGSANQDVTMASSLLGFVMYTSQKDSLFNALNTDPKNMTLLMAMLNSASSAQQAYDILIASEEATTRFTNLFGFSPVTLLDAAPYVASVTTPAAGQEKVALELQANAVHWSTAYDIVYQWKLDDQVIGTGNDFLYVPSGDSQGNHTLTLTVGKNDGSSAVDLTKEHKIVTSTLNITNNVLPQPLNLVISNPAQASTHPINSRSVTLTLYTGAALASCDSFKGLLINESATVPVSSVDFPVTCTQNNSQDVNYTIASSGDGVKTLYLWAKDSAGVISQVPSSVNVTLDTVIPTVTITTQPLAQSKSSSQSISFTGDDGVGSIDHFECKLDSSAWTGCSSPVVFSGLAEGDHTVAVRAVDAAGNISIADSKTWHIDLTAPILTLTGPGVLTNSLSASFTLSATDSGGSGLAGYSCSVDGGTYTTCTAITSLVVAAGSHSFKARAFDGAGNSSAIQTYNWTIDTTAPTVTLTSKPLATTNSQSANFSFVGSDTGGGSIAGYECALDSAAYASCSTPKSYAGLADGGHTFKVRATDTAGNLGTATTYAWTVDTSTPMASIITYPDSVTNQTTATFTFSATAPSGGSITGYECQINSGSWTACSSPKSYSSLVQGSYTFGVRSIDNNSNPSAATNYDWVIDTTLPVLTLDQTPASLTNSQTAQFLFSATDAGGGAIDGYSCQLDGGGYADCSSPRDLSALTQGSHTFDVRVKDTAGNSSTIHTHTWSVDLAAPTLTLLTTPAALTNSTTAQFTFSAGDSGGGAIAGYYCSLDGVTASSCVSGITYNALAGGVHTFEVYTTDTAGNNSAVANFSWTVDVIAPVLSITGKPAANWNSAAAVFSFVGTDTGGGAIAGYQCKIDGGAYASCSSGVIYSSLAEGSHQFHVYATDTAGNQGTVQSYSWIVDTVVPAVTIATPAGSPTVVPVGSVSSYTISGACSEDGSTVTIAGLSGVTAACSGGNWTVNLNLTALVDGSYTLSASQTDVAGNVGSSSAKIIVKDTTAPAISLTTPTAAAGGGTLSINWTVTEANVPSSSSFTVEIYDGSSWTSFGNLSATAGLNSAKSYNLNTVAAPVWNTSSARVRVTLTDQAGNATTSTSNSFTIDSGAPTLSSFTLNNGVASTTNNNVKVAVSASDALTNISKICMQTTSSIPTSSDECWVSVSSYGLTAAKTISTSSIYYNVGLSSGTYPIYIWLMDAVGNISTNAASSGVDSGSIVYNSPLPPVISAIQLTATDSPGTPPAGADLVAGAGNSVYVKWNISSVTGLSASPIQILYTTDDSTDAGTLASGLGNTANGGCSVTAGFTGCAVLSAPVGTYFRIKLKVTDALGFSTNIVSNPLNSGSVNFLAGNTDLGLGSSAKSAVMLPSGNNSLAILDDGRIFVVDTRGLAWVNPTTGVYEVLATYAATASGDGGPLTSAKFKSVNGIWVDNNNDILVADYRSIRKINTRVSPMTVTRFIGGGTTSGDYVSGALNYLATADISKLTVASNGDVYFRDASGHRLRKYTAATDIISTITFTGTGNTFSSSQDNTKCTTASYYMTFDDSGNINNLIWWMQIGGNANCPFSTTTSEGRVSAQVDPVTGVSFLPAPGYIKASGGFRDFANFYHDRSGNAYAAYNGNGSVQSIFKFNPATLKWVQLYGTNKSGTCAEDTLQSNCAISAQALAFNSQGQIFYIDSKAKAVRTIAADGKIKTLVGDRLGSDDGRQALAVRFANLTDVKSWNSSGQSYITVFDLTDIRVREFMPGNTIYTVAGVQWAGTPSAGTLAVEGPIGTSSDNYPSRMQVAANGDIYMPRGGSYFSKITRSTGLWSDVWTGYDYGPSIVAMSSNAILTNTFGYSSTYGAVDSRYNLWDSIANTLTKVVYYGGGVTTPSTICADGTALSACLVTGLTKDSGYQGAFDYVTNMWLLPEYNLKRIAQFNANGSGTMGTFFTTPRNFSRFALNRTADLSKNYIYTCGTDGKLYKYDLNNAGAETPLTLPNSTITCASSIAYDSQRNSLLFIYSQNGLKGVAEYVNP
ncbi:Ig-like domain-containing protein [Bdellovibrio sp. HCB288]|uniref:Ig-like domain-containing protein n=1 Tax=Bdellovibrio sp. HCB288 TaxID=3394355 RepID=UPI0039B38176